MTSYTWRAFSGFGGLPGPLLQTRKLGVVGETLGGITDVSLDVLVWDYVRRQPVPGWEQWTAPGQVTLLCLDDDQNVVWGGDVVRRRRSAGEYVTVDLVSPEGALDRIYPEDVVSVQVPQSQIARAYMTRVRTPSPTFIFENDDNAEPVRDRTNLVGDDKTTYTLLSELMDIQNGLEFNLRFDWRDENKTSVSRYATLRSRIGSPDNTATFTYPGMVRDFEVIEDYTRDRGALDVLAYSSGEGNARPQARARRIPDIIATGHQMFYERRFSPSSSIVDIGVLQGHANAELARVADGASEVSLTAYMDRCPRVRADWWVGDEVSVAITSPSYPPITAPDNTIRPGLERRLRIVGWSADLDANLMTPRFREVGA